MCYLILLDRSVIMAGLELESPVQLDERLAGPVKHLHDVGRETPADGEDRARAGPAGPAAVSGAALGAVLAVNTAAGDQEHRPCAAVRGEDWGAAATDRTAKSHQPT